MGIFRQKSTIAASKRLRLVNWFHHDAKNVGDRMCGASQYFWPEGFSFSNFDQPIVNVDAMVFGGGQIFGQITSTLQKLLLKSAMPSGLFAWGVGLPGKGKKDSIVRDVADHFTRFSTRNFEWKDDLEFVPCASCMSPLFNCPTQPIHDVVLYLHQKKLPNLIVPAGIPTMTNAALDAKTAIDFISSGETVVTNSYHGVYWAQLLGRKVVCVPYNDKFYTYQYAPTYAQPDDWMRLLKSASQTEPLLEEYRAINNRFASGVNDFLQRQLSE